MCFSGSHGDLWVIIRENNGMWEKIKCRLDSCYNQMKVRLSGIKMKYSWLLRNHVYIDFLAAWYCPSWQFLHMEMSPGTCLSVCLGICFYPSFAESWWRGFYIVPHSLWDSTSFFKHNNKINLNTCNCDICYWVLE